MMDEKAATTGMNRYRRSIAIRSYIAVDEALGAIEHTAKGIHNISTDWSGVDIELSVTSSRREPYAIPREITKAVIMLFRNIENARIGRKNNRLFLEIDPNVRDDINFRTILETAMDTMVLHDLRINRYESSYLGGTIGYSSLFEQCRPNQQRRGPSLWEQVGCSDSLQRLHLSVHRSDEAAPRFSENILCLPGLWEAIRRNKSLDSLSLYLFNNVSEATENEDEFTRFQRVEALSTMKALSESLNDHPSIRKLEFQCRRDAHPTTLLVPHVCDILKNSNLHEFKLERFSFYVGVEQTAFPIQKFLEALSNSKKNSTKENLEVLRLRNVGLVDCQANELLRCLPNHIQVLDLAQNNLTKFPVPANRSSSSELKELNLWKNPCLYNVEQEPALKHLLSLLQEYPCLDDFGPWDKWQCQMRVPLALQETNTQNRNNGFFGRRRKKPKNASDRARSIQNIVDEIEAVADQNRCQTRLLPKNLVLFDQPALWPTVLSQTKNTVTRLPQPRRRLLRESSKPTTQRQASVIFSTLRDNVSGGMINSVQ
jgi:hypothetical protein